MVLEHHRLTVLRYRKVDLGFTIDLFNGFRYQYVGFRVHYTFVTLRID